MRDRKVFIHVGTAKTGTTTIQHFINTNRKIFENNSFYYPMTGLVDHCHHGISFYWENNPIFNKNFKIQKDQIELLRDEINANNDKHILISSECFRLLSVNWKELLSIFLDKEIYCIVYLRNQIDYYSSKYIEQIKGNQTYLDPADWLNSNFYPNEYVSYINELKTIFGDKNIIVKSFNKKDFYMRNLLSDFLYIFDLDISNFETSKNKLNQKVTFNTLIFNRYLNYFFDSENYAYFLKNTLTDYSTKIGVFDSNDHVDYSVFSINERKKIYDQTKECNNYLNKEYFKGKVGLNNVIKTNQYSIDKLIFDENKAFKIIDYIKINDEYNYNKIIARINNFNENSNADIKLFFKQLFEMGAGK